MLDRKKTAVFRWAAFRTEPLFCLRPELAAGELGRMLSPYQRSLFDAALNFRSNMSKHKISPGGMDRPGRALLKIEYFIWMKADEMEHGLCRRHSKPEARCSGFRQLFKQSWRLCKTMHKQWALFTYLTEHLWRTAESFVQTIDKSHLFISLPNSRWWCCKNFDLRTPRRYQSGNIGTLDQKISRTDVTQVIRGRTMQFPYDGRLFVVWGSEAVAVAAGCLRGKNEHLRTCPREEGKFSGRVSRRNAYHE